MSEQKFKIGDIVKHKSGGPKMVIQKYEPTDGEFVTCEWFDIKDIPREKSFHQNTLEMYKPKQPYSKITLS